MLLSMRFWVLHQQGTNCHNGNFWGQIIYFDTRWGESAKKCNHCTALEFTVVCKIVHKFASVCCKTTLGEVGVSLSWWCAALVLLAPGYWGLYLNLKILFIMEKWPAGHCSIGQSWNFEFHKVKLLKFQSFNFDLWKNAFFFKFRKSLQ